LKNDIYERSIFPGNTDILVEKNVKVKVNFENEILTGVFKKMFLEENTLFFEIITDFRTMPFFYFGKKAQKVIINTGTEEFCFNAEYCVNSIEKDIDTLNYNILIGAPHETFVRN